MYRTAWVLVRWAGLPIGSVVVRPDNAVLPGRELAAAASAALGISLDLALRKPNDNDSGAPDITVAVCTRERPEGLKRCLASLRAQEPLDFKVLVVDNAPETGSTRAVVDEFKDQMPLEYVREEIPGLSRARNRVLLETDSEIIAWIDDDEVADPSWVHGLAASFRDGEVACACGLVLPAELETRAQVWFEQWGGHSKGRGYTPEEFSLSSLGRRGAVYPLPQFGEGANMAVRRDAIRRIGGFDESLGAGSRAKGGEDTLALTELLLSGATIAYDPRAITRHYHRVDEKGLRRQLGGYGTGLTAFYTALVLTHPGVLPDVLGLLPRALHDLRSPMSIRNAGIDEDFPRDVLAANKWGLFLGPWAYLAGRLELKLRRRPHRIR
jgi:GT2 family glycosyltransferase